jgi:hypothetical protein
LAAVAAVAEGQVHSAAAAPKALRPLVGGLDGLVAGARNHLYRTTVRMAVTGPQSS